MTESRDTPEVGPEVGPYEAVEATSTWVWLQVGAMGFSLNHVLLDFFIGLFGPPQEVTASAGVLIILVALIYASWALALARAVGGRPNALPSLMVYAVLWAFVGNGGSIALCPPPCAGAVPFGEIAHVGSLVLGALAAYSTWKPMTASTRPSWSRAAPDLILIVVTFYTLSLLASG